MYKGLYASFRPAREGGGGGGGFYTGGKGVCTKIFIMHFSAQNAFHGLYEGRNGRLQEKYFFAAKKWGLLLLSR